MNQMPHHQSLLNKKRSSLDPWSPNFSSWILQKTLVSMGIRAQDSQMYNSPQSLVRTRPTTTHLWNLPLKTRASLFTMTIHQFFKKIQYNHEPSLILVLLWQQMINRSIYKERISSIKSFSWKSSLTCSKEDSNPNRLITLKLLKWLEAFMMEHLHLRRNRISYNR
jgi:hypothetical protein